MDLMLVENNRPACFNHLHINTLRSVIASLLDIVPLRPAILLSEHPWSQESAKENTSPE